MSNHTIAKKEKKNANEPPKRITRTEPFDPRYIPSTKAASVREGIQSPRRLFKN